MEGLLVVNHQTARIASQNPTCLLTLLKIDVLQEELVLYSLTWRVVRDIRLHQVLLIVDQDSWGLH